MLRIKQFGLQLPPLRLGKSCSGGRGVGRGAQSLRVELGWAGKGNRSSSSQTTTENEPHASSGTHFGPSSAATRGTECFVI